MQYIKCKIPNTEYRIRNTSRAFTLVETLVAISLISIAIVAPMTLTTRSFAGSYYARDQITAYHLAQEAIESVRHARDRNVLKIALGETVLNLLGDIPIDTDFTIDTTTNINPMIPCPPLPNPCPPLKRSSEGLYNYSTGVTTQFTRTVNATFVPGSDENEINLTVNVSWQTGSYPKRDFTISENLFRWVEDGSAAR